MPVTTEWWIDALGYAAVALLVAAMLMTAMRPPRWIALAAGLAALGHFALQPGFGFGFGIGTAAALLFVAANAAQLFILVMRGRSGQVLDDERALFTQVLGVEHPRQRSRLRDLLEWRDIEGGAVLMHQGQAEPPLAYVASGAAQIDQDGQRVGICAKGDFLGEMSLVSGQRASATVTASGPMRIAVFDRDALGQFAREVPEVGHALQGALNRGLAAKLERMNRSRRE